MKTCKRCGVERPLPDFYRAVGTRDGRQAVCRPCVVEALRDKRGGGSRENPVAAGERQCRKCGERKPLAEFYKISPTAHRWECRSCYLVCRGGPVRTDAQRKTVQEARARRALAAAAGGAPMNVVKRCRVCGLRDFRRPDGTIDRHECLELEHYMRGNDEATTYVEDCCG